jgi:alkylation response protein AidB-like acyl-CoA dehydrogenase
MTDTAVSTMGLAARAKAVAAIADECAESADRQGQLSAPVVEALHREGLLGMWVPRSIHGGAELDPVSSLEVIENLSYGDPSAGWVLMAAALAIGTGAAYLKDPAVDELFNGERLPVIAGQGTRPGTAVPKPGGFSLSGSSFASGIGTAPITLLGSSRHRRAADFVLPVGKATLIENWDVLGLRGTGSIDYRTEEVFVPEAYTHFAVTEAPLRGGALYTMGIAGFALICHSGWACGIGRRLLDELVKKVQSGIGRSGTQATSETFHEQYANAEAKYRSAKALVYETWGDVQETLGRGGSLSVRQHTLMRLALSHITWSCRDIADFVYHAAGTVALRAGTIQRLFRDMHAGTQHITSAPFVIRSTGRELAGLAEGKRWVFLELVDQG